MRSEPADLNNMNLTLKKRRSIEMIDLLSFPGLTEAMKTQSIL